MKHFRGAESGFDQPPHARFAPVYGTPVTGDTA